MIISIETEARLAELFLTIAEFDKKVGIYLS
jgi:hypothetical protein